ncbi:NUDIX hydrolase [Paraburkholderia megapolitana]|uniref:8-oxo-dGTP diphosphatase n=1 Tax=Paraburkholderia megapolitana TaxID=420953 RepID=A0A1I3GRN2_9BURK|nr:NUDIX domain-containing protein [Paraburkholderia megapolitana]QDQ83021.1 NUDIX domain-containing protein [Paraburkholderia megapolitana]SFI26002.1 8-oxo-dGTP diphosphatase [Paraburkholderia megapolitana]
MAIKHRATVICHEAGHVLLVARTLSRWALPGGRVKPGETLRDAALRELREETSLHATNVTYLFQFGGIRTRHYVFVATLPGDAIPKPANEIERCGWFPVSRIASLPASVSTRGIVQLMGHAMGHAHASLKRPHEGMRAARRRLRKQNAGTLGAHEHAPTRKRGHAVKRGKQSLR